MTVETLARPSVETLSAGGLEAEPKHPSRLPRAGMVWTAACAVFAVGGWLLAPSPAGIAAFAAAYLAGAAGPVRTMLLALRQRQISVDFLMLLAAAGAASIGDWTEGAVLLFLFSLSGTLEAYAMYRTRSSIDALIQLRPREATLVRDGEERRVAVAALTIGDVIRVRPGERFAVDGEVIEGETWADESTLTGESAPQHKTAGAEVFAATMNGRGSVLVRMTRAVADTTLERIVRMVQEAQAEKTRTQRVLEAWQGPYVLTVLAGALLVFAGALIFHDPDPADAFYHAMVVLVVASPCAVVVSSPSVVLSAIARAARHGVLFKGGHHLDLLGRVEIMAFDKTGTITLGKPAVITVWTPNGARSDRLVQLAAAIERRSEHHLAEAIVAEAQRRGLALPEITEFENHTGLGVHGHVNHGWVGIGREELFSSHEIAVPPEVVEAARAYRADGHTVLLVLAPEDNLSGVLVLADQVRPDAADALAALKRFGIHRNVILTGDHEKVAQRVGEAVHADAVCAGLLPDQKVLELRQLMDGGSCLAMVGDGVNDAPALATAQVGIAMGGAGTDVALEVAGVVLMRDDLQALPFAIWLSRQARRRIRQNMIFAFGMIGVLLASTFFGLPLWLGVIGHEGSTVLVVFNGLRLLWEKASAQASRGGNNSSARPP